MIGLELMGVFQLAYLILVDQPNINPYLSPLTSWVFVNGYNLNHLKNVEEMPSNLKAIQYTYSFIENVNLMLAVLLFEVVVACTLVFLSLKFVYLTKISRVLIKEVFLSFLIFNVFNIAFSFGLQSSATPENSKYFLMSNVAAILSLLICMFAVVGLAFFRSRYFGEYKDKFKASFAMRMYIPLTILYRFSLGFCMSYYREHPYVTLYLLAINMAFVLYNLINLPFQNAYQNYRANICHLTEFVIILVANYYNVMKSNIPIQERNKLTSAAVIEILCIIICLFLSALSLILEFCFPI